MRSAHHTLISATALAILIFGAAPALAGADGPKACAPHAQRFDVPGLWLGHFSGGRTALLPNGDPGVDWRSEYQCFFTARDCHVWRAAMKRHYGRYEGYGTCIALRGGGAPIVRVTRAVRVLSVRY